MNASACSRPASSATRSGCMRLAASRNSVFRSSVGGGPGGGGIGAHRGRRLAEALLGRAGRGPVVDRARAHGDDREDARLELLHLHVDDADLPQVVGLERAQLRAQRRVLLLELARAGRGALRRVRGQGRSGGARMRSPSTRSPLWSYSLVTQARKFGGSRRGLLGEARARRRGPRCRSRPRSGPCCARSTSGSYSRGHSCCGELVAASRAGASAP